MLTHEGRVFEMIEEGVNDPENIAVELDMDIDDVHGYIAALEQEGRITQASGYIEVV